MVTPSYTRTAPHRGAVLLFVCRSTPSCRGAQRNKCPWGTTSPPSRCARLLALHRRGGRLCPPPYTRIPCDFVGAMPTSLRPCHCEPALTLARQSVPPAKKKSLRPPDIRKHTPQKARFAQPRCCAALTDIQYACGGAPRLCTKRALFRCEAVLPK